uniref:Receptor ligand binding region domain-containing protein n=1 Tax=Timema bartmani TaxID=61472 RepID=A0A7R9EXZ4_9NEOP|nr:unnamed protein product [Timema bartmani]
MQFQKCADTKVSDKRVYYTFARTLPPSSKVSKSVVALLRAFSWDKFVIVASRRPAWGGQVKDAIKKENSLLLGLASVGTMLANSSGACPDSCFTKAVVDRVK